MAHFNPFLFLLDADFFIGGLIVIQKAGFKRSEAAIQNGLPYILHEHIHKSEVVNSCQPVSQQFFAIEKVVHIGRRMILAGKTVTGCIYRFILFLVTAVSDIYAPGAGK